MLPTLIEELYAHPYEFDFFQAVYLLELAGGDRLSVGLQGPPDREAVRFRALPSMNFPPSSIYSLGRENSAIERGPMPPPVMTVAFFGLTGPNGALPVHYTQTIIKQLERGRGDERTALRDWLDLFNHRLTSLFYRAWEKYHFGVPFLRYLRARSLAQGGLPGTANTMQISIALQAKRTEPDPFTLALLNTVGLGPPKLRNRLHVAVRLAELPGDLSDEAIDHQRLASIDDLALLHYGGLFAQRPRNASALAAIISDFFRLPVKVVQFSGQWLNIPASQQSRLDEDANNQLGVNAIAGERIWDVSSSFRLRIGPLDLETFQDLLPDRTPRPRRKAFFLLSQLVRLYVGPEFDFEVQLLLKGSDVPECHVREGGRDVIGARLGWNTWLKVGPMHDDDKAYFAGDETTEIPADVRTAG
ncbi:MAG: type VI secretion system baseplate subunit TssG [Gemmataceae bacterium]